MSGSTLPLRALAVFEAAARLMSFRAAAAELNITPSAVSHQVRALEERLGSPLFERIGRGIALSPEGGQYYKDIRDSFRRLHQATEAAARRGHLGNASGRKVEVVRIQTPPSLASQWLLPRLPAFLARHPGLDIRVSAETGRSLQDLDLAIVYGTAERWAREGEPFLAETLQPLCAPKLLAANRIEAPRDLLKLPLIRSRWNMLTWDDWFRAQGLERDGASAKSIQLDPSHVAIDAAVKGLGVVLESDLLTEEDVASGRLVPPLTGRALAGRNYWIIVPPNAQGRDSVETVRRWLLARDMKKRGAMGQPTIYGIKNCDTMKKARDWLDKQGIAYAFHDYKASGIDQARLESWAKQVGWEVLLNRAGTTFRKLPDKDREGLDQKKAIALMRDQPSMIKRPVLDLGGKLLVGFKPEAYAGAFTPRS